MELSPLSKTVRAMSRRGGPVARLLVLLLAIPSVGCWWRHSTRPSYDDHHSAAEQYYQDAVANSAESCIPATAVEIPKSPKPLSPTEPEADEKWPLSLRDALEIALTNSDVVRQLGRDGVTAVATRYDAALAETRVQEELARFDAQLILNLFWSEDKVQVNNNVAPGGGLVNVTEGNPFIFEQDAFGDTASRRTGLPGSGDVLSLRKQFATGTEVTIGASTDYTFSNASNRAFPAAYDSRAFTSIRQPLAQGAGSHVNRAPILIARLRSDQALSEFKRSVISMLEEVERAYWTLYLAQWQYASANQAVEISREIVKTLEAQLEAGPGNQSDLEEAKRQYHEFRRQRMLALSGSEGAGEVVLGARGSGLHVAERQLRAYLGLPHSDGRRIVAIDEPAIAPITYDWDSVIAEAMTFNPEIEVLKLQVAEQRQRVLIARNSMLPRIDLFVRGEVNGLEGELDESVGVVTDAEFGSWVAGVQVQVDVGYRRASAQLEREMQQLAQLNALVRDKAREVEARLSDQYSGIETRYETYQAATSARFAAERQLEIQRLLYEQGRITLDRVLNALSAYTQTVSREIQDKVEYQVLVARLEAAKGTIFRYNNVHIHEGPWSPPAYKQSIEQEQDRERAIQWHHGPKTVHAPEPLRAHEHTYPSFPTHEPMPLETPREAPPELLPPPSAPALGANEIPVDLTRRDANNAKRDEPPTTLTLTPAKVEPNDPPITILSDDPAEPARR